MALPAGIEELPGAPCSPLDELSVTVARERVVEALGKLREAERATFERHLDEGCCERSGLLAATVHAVAPVGLSALPAGAPPPELKRRVLDAVRSAEAPSPPAPATPFVLPKDDTP